MRNWPYAHSLVQDPAASRVAGHVAVGPLPAAEGGTPAAALGGARLAINAHSAHPQQAFQLIQFLTAPEQLLERARMAGHFPPRRSLYAGTRLAGALSVPPDQARRIIEAAVPRPVTPVYAELSAALQVELHAALSGQREPAAALTAAAGQMRRILLQTQPTPSRARGTRRLAPGPRGARRPPGPGRGGPRLAPGPPPGIARPPPPRPPRRRAPGLGPGSPRPGDHCPRRPRPAAVDRLGISSPPRSPHALAGATFVALDNYQLLLGSSRFWAALGHSALFAAIAVTAEVILGMVLALALHHVVRGRGSCEPPCCCPGPCPRWWRR